MRDLFIKRPVRLKRDASLTDVIDEFNTLLNILNDRFEQLAERLHDDQKIDYEREAQLIDIKQALKVALPSYEWEDKIK